MVEVLMNSNQRTLYFKINGCVKNKHVSNPLDKIIAENNMVTILENRILSAPRSNACKVRGRHVDELMLTLHVANNVNMKHI